MSGAPDGERWARAVIAAATEPGDRAVHRALAEHGAVALLERFRAGAYDDPEGPGAALARFAPRVAAIETARLQDETGAAAARVVVPGDAEWPPGLDELGELDGSSSPPVALWVRGPAPLPVAGTGQVVAVVGARASTTYGVEVATTLGFELAERGLVVVSGAAYGIDGAAHRGALAAGGCTVAVLASGVDQPYPAGHEALVRRIAEVGAVVSEAAPGRHPTRVRFLTRNRVIAALSDGVVVVEAALRSGALNTATWATQLSRHVMAVPGPVTSAMSAGPHRAVIDRGATLVTDAADVVEILAPVGTGLQHRRRGPERAVDALSPEVLAVLDALPTRGHRDAGQLAVAAGVAVDVAIAALGRLDAEGWVERTEAGWRRRPDDRR